MGWNMRFQGWGRRKPTTTASPSWNAETGQQTLEIDFLQRVLQRVEEARMLQALNGTAPSTRQIDQEVEWETAMTVVRMCHSTKVSRAGFYRRQNESDAEDRDLDLRDEIQKIALEMPAYGRRRITAELRRRGWEVNHKRVHRIMREDNLLCLRRRKFVVTTDSNHPHPVYPNVAAGMEPTGVNQLWVADITYIRLELEFVYLAVILDAFSRRVVGWALDRTLELFWSSENPRPNTTPTSISQPLAPLQNRERGDIVAELAVPRPHRSAHWHGSQSGPVRRPGPAPLHSL